MVQLRPTAREIVAKIVYYGPPLGGKTTNLRMLWEGYPEEVRGELIVLPTGTDRTIYFDYLPLTFRKLRGLDLKIQLYTVPGQVRFDSTRQVVLRGVDGIVFVADSQRQVLAANRESWANLKKNLALQGLFLDRLPHVLQYNKRDLPDIASVEELDAELNEFNAPFFEAVAVQGIGVEETLQSIVRLVVRSLRDRFNLGPEPHPAPRTAELVTKPLEVKPQPLPREEPRGVLHPFPLPPPEITPPTVPVELEELKKPEAEKPPVQATPGEAALPTPLQEQEPAFAPPEPPAPVLEPFPSGEPSPLPGEASPFEPAAPAPEVAELAWEAPPAAGAPGGSEAFASASSELQLPENEPSQAPEPAPEVPFLALEEPPAPEPSTPPGAVFPSQEPAPFDLAPAEPAAAPGIQEELPPAPQPPRFAQEVAGEPPLGSPAPAEAGLQAAPFAEAAPEAAAQEPFPQEELAAAAAASAGATASAEAGPLSDPFALPPEAPLAGEDVFVLLPAPPAEVLPPAAAVERVMPRAVARHAELRELEVEVPVPAAWVGGRRVTLQLRLTLVPEEESHEP
jgi:hypothetical protein